MTDSSSTHDFSANEHDFAVDAYEPAPARVDAAALPVKEPARSAKRSGVDRATVRRVTAKYEELLQANTEHLELLSAALGTPNTPADLTLAIITGKNTGLIGLTDTLALAVHADPFDGIVSAISLGRTRIKGVWAILAEMGALSGPIPVADVKAGGTIARAASEMDELDKTEIAAVLALAKR